MRKWLSDAQQEERGKDRHAPMNGRPLFCARRLSQAQGADIIV